VSEAIQACVSIAEFQVGKSIQTIILVWKSNVVIFGEFATARLEAILCKQEAGRWGLDCFFAFAHRNDGLHCLKNTCKIYIF